jgi:hypothetical protein
VTLRLNGSTSGYTEIDAPAVAGSNTITLPTGAGSAYQVIRNGATAGSLEFTDKIVSGTAVASTSGTSIDFTGIPSWVKRVTVMFAGVSTNGTSLPTLRLGTSSGFVTSGYLGATAHIGGGTLVYANHNSAFKLTSAMAAVVTMHGHVTLANLTSNTWTLSGSMGRSDDNFTLLTSGSISLGGVFDRLRITTENGTDTFDAGSINILYE